MAQAQAAQKQRADVVVVTPDTFETYVAGQTPKKAEAPKVDPESPEGKAAAELEKVESEKAERLKKEAGDKGAEKDEEIDHPDEKKKGALKERFSELTSKRKEAEAAREKAAAEAKAAREERDAIQRERDELRAKYEPPKSDELGPKPERAQFVNETEYDKALEDWAGEKALKEKAKAEADERTKKEQEQLAKDWTERQGAYTKENPDYSKDIEASDVKVSDQVRDAIIESEVGPALLHHLAKNKEDAERIGKMTVRGALRELGRMEERILAKTKNTQTKDKTPVADIKAELSKAPPPISPITNPTAPVVNLSGKDDVPSNWSYEDWKAARKAGRIR